ncbi:unnamed protein product [Clonostachys solani]|uniref:RRM domain-containing protein n=1 Tax=Clonostachys solani TaxID=160281 RepID=A0A9P0EBZ8_9HYPO|nr:unnamed protein product [Clonostachys solani]
MEPNTSTFHAQANASGRQNNAAHAAPGGVNGADANSMMSHFAGLSLHGMNMPQPGPIAVGPTPWIGPPAGFVGMHQAMYDHFAMGHAQMSEVPYAAQIPAHGSGGALFGLHVPVNTSMMPYTPGRPTGPQPRVDRGHSDVPGLENRRGSYSTTESTPATPFWGGVASREGGGPRVASLDRSTYTTPSPQQLGMSALHVETSKPAVVSDAILEELSNRKPAIPKAVPAVFTPPGQMKSLEQSLENRIPGNRNVYIRGLHPTTDDEMLFHFASRYGAVETSKAIIDTGTGACKGFGFAKFDDPQSSEMCIRGFHRLGYEVGFARESFNSRLKAQGDDGSTNLYISNLPKTLNEVELGTIFLGYNILSSKILRDSMGNSRGVGFARFEGRTVCDEIIRKFNGVSIGHEGLLMNIRYADTPAQKELKRVTAERRQFRTNEYNIGAYGTPLVGLSPNLYTPGQWRRNGAPPSRSEGSSSARAGGQSAAGHKGSQRGDSQAATSDTTDSAVSSPNSSECDEGVTIHADPAVEAVDTLSGVSSPSAYQEVVKKEIVSKEVIKNEA